MERTEKEIFGKRDPEKCLIRWKFDFKGFAENVLGLHIKPFHLEWVWALENFKRVAIMAPTGFGKTEIFGVSFPLWKSYYAEGLSFLVTSGSIHQSTDIVKSVKNAIVDNEVLQKLIPPDSWRFGSKTELDFANKCRYLCKPYGETIKGVHVNYVLGDEIASYRDQSIWFKYVVTRATAKKGVVAGISTPVSETDLMSKLFENKQYWSRAYSAIVDGKSIWPERFSLDWLKLRRHGLGDGAFNLQYLCNTKIPIISDEAQPFNLKRIIPSFRKELKFEKESTEGQYYATIDPAFSVTGDWNAVAIGKRRPDKKIQLVSLFRTKLDDVLRAYIKTAHDKFHFIKIAIDTSTGGSMVLRQMAALNLPVVGFSFVQENRNAAFRATLSNFISGNVIIPTSKKDADTTTMTDVLVHELTHIKLIKTPVTRVQSYTSTSRYDDCAMAFLMLIKIISDAQPFVSYCRTGDAKDRPIKREKQKKKLRYFNIDTTIQ